ncbi:MAG: aspartate aminotransferase family protein [Nitrospinota bacterium]
MKTKAIRHTSEDLLTGGWREQAEVFLKTDLPGPRAQKWIEHYDRFAAPSTYVYPFVWDLAGPAEGPFCSDPDRNVFLDFYAHVASAPLGYNHPKILRDCGVPFEPIKTADHDSYLAAGPDPDRPLPLRSAGEAARFLTPGHLQERLLATARGLSFDCVFFVNSGAEANENAVKIATYRKFRQVRANLGLGRYRKLCRQLGIREDGHWKGIYEDYPFFGLAAHNGFHGRTLGVLTSTHSRPTQKEGFPTLRWTRHFRYNAPLQEIEALMTHESLDFLLETDRLAKVVFEERKIPRELLAFVIVEPIQGEGGYVFPEGDFLAKLAGFARSNGALFIADEVQTGLGRVGSWWACQRFDVIPDLITSAKALRVGAVMGKREVFPEKPGGLSSTWGGGPIACAVGARTIGVIEEENLLENTANMGRFLLEGLETLAETHPAVTAVRALGLLAALDLESREMRDALVQAAFRRGLLTLGCGERTVRLLPPLNVWEREIEIAQGILGEALMEIEEDRGRPRSESLDGSALPEHRAAQAFPS